LSIIFVLRLTNLVTRSFLRWPSRTIDSLELFVILLDMFRNF